MKLKFEAIDKATIEGLEPMKPYEYKYIASGALAISKDANGEIMIYASDDYMDSVLSGDNLELEILDGGQVKLYVWQGYKISAVLYGRCVESE